MTSVTCLVTRLGDLERRQNHMIPGAGNHVCRIALNLKGCHSKDVSLLRRTCAHAQPAALIRYIRSKIEVPGDLNALCQSYI